MADSEDNISNRESSRHQKSTLTGNVSTSSEEDTAEQSCVSAGETASANVTDNRLSEQTTEPNVEKDIECAICLQPCIHPVQLPCAHIFCFLCVKGAAHQSKRCAMCRQEIPPDYLENPTLLHWQDLDRESAFEDGYQWFYEGRSGGWWQYDERTSRELEASYKNLEQTCELLIAGFLYVVDFRNMVQVRRNDPSRRRRIKRALSTITKKGIAGLRHHSHGSTRDPETDEESPGIGAESLDTLSPNPRVKSPVPIPAPPTNTPQTPHTPSTNSNASSPGQADESLHRAMEQIRRLSLARRNGNVNDSLAPLPRFRHRSHSEDDAPGTTSPIWVALSSEEDEV